VCLVSQSEDADSILALSFYAPGTGFAGTTIRSMHGMPLGALAGTDSTIVFAPAFRGTLTVTCPGNRSSLHHGSHKRAAGAAGAPLDKDLRSWQDRILRLIGSPVGRRSNRNRRCLARFRFRLCGEHIVVGRSVGQARIGCRVNPVHSRSGWQWRITAMRLNARSIASFSLEPRIASGHRREQAPNRCRDHKSQED